MDQELVTSMFDAAQQVLLKSDQTPSDWNVFADALQEIVDGGGNEYLTDAIEAARRAAKNIRMFNEQCG